MLLTSHCLVLLLCLASLAGSQAPGDGDQVCIDLSLHPEYEDNTHPLMDSRDYIQVLPGTNDGPWQKLNLDENNQDNQKTQWQQIGLSCSTTPTVCGYNSGPQNNWIITQHISRQVLVGATTVNLPTVQLLFDLALESCPSSSSCVEALSLYVWETSAPNATSAANTDNYHFIANFSSGTTPLTIDFPSAQHTGFYLGIRDNGTCVDRLDRVLVYYVTCEAATVGLARVGEAVFSSGSAVRGECVANSVAIQETGPLLVCSERGEWSVASGCHCSTQHYMDNTAPQCLECPPNSEATQTGLAECTCVPGYYRATDEGPSVACTQSPSAPRNVTVSSVTNTSVSLSWTAPEYSGGRNSSEITYTVTYTEKQITGVSVTSVEVEGLTPFLNYTFSVTAENAVSSQDSDVTGRTTNTIATTEEGVAAKVTNVMPVGTDIIKWSPPNPPHGEILYYNIKIIRQPSGDMELVSGYDRTFTSSDVWTNEWNVTDSFTIQVQAVTRIGAGEFSEPVSIISTTVPSDDNTLNIPTILLVSILVPGVVVLLIIVGALFIVGHVSGRISRKRQPARHTRRQNTTDYVEEYAMGSPHNFSDDSAFFSSPPVPTSPRPSIVDVPTQNNDCYGRHTDSANGTVHGRPTQPRSSNEFNNWPLSGGPQPEVEGPTYGMLEGPTETTMDDGEHHYSLDPTYYTVRATNPIFETTAIDEDDEAEPASRNANGGLNDLTDSAYAVLECPMQTRSSSEFDNWPLRAGPKVEDHTYGVLDGPTAKNPISNSATIDGGDGDVLVAKDENGEKHESGAQGSRSDATNKFERHYFELENRNKSSVLTKHEEQHELTAPPLSESVMSDAYWNDGMGPPGCVLVTPTHNSRQPSSPTHVLPPPTLTSTPESPCTTDQSTTTGDPTYLQLSSQNAE